jgi:hypothetical protein
MDSGTFYSEFWPNLAGTVAGGFLLSFAFFLLKEWVFPVPNLTGVWECELITGTTDYRPYEGMKLWYRVSILQSGTEISGLGELHRESSSVGDRSYEGSSRRKVEITGCVTKRILRPDLIHLAWSEEGQLRTFSSVFFLHISGSRTSGGLWGRYVSTAANSRGYSNWNRVSS